MERLSEIITINPATGLECGRYSLMSQPAVDQLIIDMDHVQKAWATTAFSLRKKYLLALGRLLLDAQKEAAALMTREMGKPMAQSLLEVEKCARLCEYYAEYGEKFLEPEMIHTEFYKTYRSFQPLGIIFAIMPWNFPFWQVMRFAVPNLMVGNAGLLKHAPNCTGTALYIEQLVLKAGFPRGLFRSLIVDVSLSPFVIHHPLITGVTLTGSNRAGKSVAEEAGSALKKVVLELGGSDPFVILEDADLELAAEQAVSSRLNNAGQVCIAAKRIIVVEAVRAQLQSLILEKVKHYEMGDPSLLETKLGPMARDDLRTALHEQIERSIKSGARCLLGGKMPKGQGYYYPATVLVDVTVDSPAFQEELFGPVICIISAANEKEALTLANKTEFGLGGAIFTRNIEKGERLARDVIQAGTCAVNTLVASDPRLPFGGTKQSGFGRELSLEGMREFVNIKTIIINNP